jgi:hypothetical protein
MRTFKTIISLLILTAGLLFVLTGCSMDSAPTSGNATSETVNQSDNDGYVPAPPSDYPPLTPGELTDGPAPGFQFKKLSREAATLDGGPRAVSRFIFARFGGDVQISHLVKVHFSPWDLPRDLQITIWVPDDNYAVADFGPHPMQFNGDVEITWSVYDMFHLPDDYDFSQLVPWYVNDQGQYVPVVSSWTPDHHYLTIRTNHFSRYIISEPIISNPTD